jgi:hypothetical protein
MSVVRLGQISTDLSPEVEIVGKHKRRSGNQKARSMAITSTPVLHTKTIRTIIAETARTSRMNNKTIFSSEC